MLGAADGAGAFSEVMRLRAPGPVSSDNGLATWRPRWRFAVLCMLLTLAMLGASGSAFAQQSAACHMNGLDPPMRPTYVMAKVQGPASPEEVRRQTQIAEKRTGGAVSPDFADFPRIIAIYVVNGASHSTIAAVVDGVIPQVGEIVKLASRFRDPRRPCNFIPWTVVSKSSDV